MDITFFLPLSVKVSNASDGLAVQFSADREIETLAHIMAVRITPDDVYWI